jgi:molybdate transport system substrate-binding protein
VDDEGKVLKEGRFDRLAIANPKTAPYGSASMEILDSQGQITRLSSRLVRGDSVAQTHQFVATGSAELGFVALAQVVMKPEGSHWEVPQSLHTPIRQDAVLLNTRSNGPAALALIDYLKSSEARAVIERFGYAVETGPAPGTARGLEARSGQSGTAGVPPV